MSMATPLKGAVTATIARKEGPYVAASAEGGSMTPARPPRGGARAPAGALDPARSLHRRRPARAYRPPELRPRHGAPRAVDRARRGLRRHVRRARVPALATRRGDRRAGGRRPCGGASGPPPGPLPASLAAGTRIETGDGRLDDLLRRSALDLRALVDHTPSGPMLTAGIPWYAVPFGRDALITGLETLDFQPELALGALRFLAAHQGQRVDPFTEEEPGRIFHELRRGELARMGAVPHRPYFGTVDATPLFVRLFVETVRWLGDRRIYDELLPHALAALEWCDTHGDPDGDGFVEHSSLPGSPLRNKGWKDSATSLCYRYGSPVELPAALVEVQAYVYAAKDGLAQLSAELGDGALAERLAAEAAALRERFEAAFWLPAERCYAQALDAGKRPGGAGGGNAGHCLWAGVGGAGTAS